MRAQGRVDAALAVPLVLLTAISIVPFGWVLFSAFKTGNEILVDGLALPDAVRWSNFVAVWNDGQFATYFVNSLGIAIGATVLTVAVTATAGYAFGKLVTPRTEWLFYLYLLVLTLPIEAIVVPIFYQMRELGLVDSRIGLMLLVVAKGVPFGAFLMRNSFRDLPNDLAEAAQVDGASDWRTFRSVMLPLAKPAVLAIAVFSFLDAWNEYQLALLLLTSDETHTIPVGLVQFQGQYSSDYGPVFAGMVLAMIPSIAVYAVLQRSFTRGLVAGSLK